MALSNSHSLESKLEPRSFGDMQVWYFCNRGVVSLQIFEDLVVFCNLPQNCPRDSSFMSCNLFTLSKVAMLSSSRMSNPQSSLLTGGNEGRGKHHHPVSTP